MHQIWGSFFITLSFLDFSLHLTFQLCCFDKSRLFVLVLWGWDTDGSIWVFVTSHLFKWKAIPFFQLPPDSCFVHAPVASSNCFLYGVQNNSCYLVTVILPWLVGELLLTPRVSFYVTSSIPKRYLELGEVRMCDEPKVRLDGNNPFFFFLP